MSESSRSRSYPAIDLYEAVEVILRKLVRDLGWGDYDRDAIAEALNYTSATSGSAIRKISALSQYNIINKSGEFFSLTPLARALYDSKDDATLESSRREAFLSPTLFREVIETHLHSGRVPRLLAHSLHSHGIASNAKDEVARLFMASAQFARVLAADGVFEESYLRSLGRGSMPKPQTHPQGEAPAEPMSAQDEQDLKISLTDGKLGYIRLPCRLNDQDIRILKKQIEVLETQVDANKAAPPLSFPRRQDRGSS